MGIKKLNKFLSEHNLVTQYSTLTKYVNIRKKDKITHITNSNSIVIAVDFWLYAHKFTYSYGNMIIGFWNQIIKLLSHKIIPLYVYDGTPPQEKDSIIQYRQRKRLNMENKLNTILDDYTPNESQENERIRLEKSIIYIKKSDVDNVKNLFDILNIPYLNAVGEADALCAKLYKEGYIHACLTDDMDLLAHGCGRTIKFHEGKIYEFNLTHILTELNLSHNQFVEMCILFGCDYIHCIKINIEDSFRLIKKHKTIEGIINSEEHEILNNNNEKSINFINNYHNAKNIFSESVQNEIIPTNFKISLTNEIDYFIVFQYLKVYGQINFVNDNIQQIIESIEYVNNFISHNVFNNVS